MGAARTHIILLFTSIKFSVQRHISCKILLAMKEKGLLVTRYVGVRFCQFLVLSVVKLDLLVVLTTR